MNLRDKKVIIGIVLIVLVLLGGGFYFLSLHKSSPSLIQDTGTNQTIGTLTPDQIGLALQINPEKNKVKFSVQKASDIKSIDYDITYDADIPPAEKVDGSDTNRVTRDIHGEGIKPSNGSYTSDWLDLGSCSRNICHYDTGVTSVKITLKVTKVNGSIYQVERSTNL